MNEIVAVCLFILAQTGLLLWKLSSIDTKVINLTGWVKAVAQESRDNALTVANLKGELGQSI